MTMLISKEDVERVAKLARLEVNEAEIEVFSRQLSHILSYIEQLRSWDTATIEPTSTVVDQSNANALRDDQARPSVSLEEALRNAPDVEGGSFQVPKVLDER